MLLVHSALTILVLAPSWIPTNRHPQPFSSLQAFSAPSSQWQAVRLATTPRITARTKNNRLLPNSFIRRKVSTASDLVSHVRADPVVADRYRRHFAMNQSDLLRFLGGLHRGQLAAAGYHTVYGVLPNGRIKVHVERLPRGEPVFLDAKNRPVLVAKCGNPLLLKRRLGPPKFVPPPPEKEVERELPLEPEYEPSDVLALMPSVPEIVDEFPPTPPVPEPFGTAGVSLAGSGSSIYGLEGLLLFPLIRHHNNPPIPPGPPTTPGPAAAAAFGLTSLTALRRRSKRAAKSPSLRRG